MKNSFKGGLWITLSAMGYASYGIWSRLMQSAFGEFSQAWTRALLLFLILLPLGILTHNFKKISGIDWLWFTIIGISGGLNQAPYYFGFAHLTIGTATLLFYTWLTIGAYLIGKIFFRENITRVKWTALLLAILGLCIIYRLSLSPDQLLPAFSSSLAGLMGGSFVVFTKKISHKHSEIQILSFTWIMMLFFNFMISLIVKDPLPLFGFSTPWVAQIGYTLCMLLANLAVIIGYKYLEPSVGGLIGLSEVMFAALYGILLFGEHLTLSLILGSGVILLAIAWPDVIRIFTSE